MQLPLRRSLALATLSLALAAVAALPGSRPAHANPIGVASIEAGWIHSCAVTQANDLACWGQNEGGKLGYPNHSEAYPTSSLRPIPVDTVAGSVAAAAVGYMHTCAVSLTGGAPAAVLLVAT